MAAPLEGDLPRFKRLLNPHPVILLLRERDPRPRRACPDGQRAEALRHYERLVRLLAAELDAEPEEETTALYDRLRQAEPV